MKIGELTMKKEKLLNKIICAFVIICCCITPVINADFRVQAKTKDVTNTVSGKNDIKELTQILATPCGYDLTELMKKGRTKKYDFSKASDRRNILNLCYEEIYSVGERVVSIRMFGENTNNIDLLVGDWGVAGPIIVIKKIYKIDSKKYKVVANVNWYNSDDNSSKKIGRLRLYLKKDTNSYYGYIAKSMKLEKVSEI